MKVLCTPRALEDLAEIRRYIAEDSRTAARRWVTRLEQRVSLAALAPLAGRVVPEIDAEEVREVFVRSYRVAYHLVARELRVLTVFEGHRRFPRGAVPDDDERGV